MNKARLIIRSLLYYRRPTMAILAGVVISTGILAGALIIGDSVRYSLRQHTEIRLGKTHFAIQPGEKFFRQELAKDLSEITHTLVVPAIQTEGIAINTDKDLRVNKVNIIGIDRRFTELWEQPEQNPGEDEAIISRNLAEKINIQPGDEILLKIRKPGKAPRNAPFVAEKLPSVSFRLKVTGIAEDKQMGRFSLKNNQTAPFNIFISLKQMAAKLDLAGYSNMLLIAGNDDPEFNPTAIDSLIRTVWKASDAGIKIRKPDGISRYEITSDRIFLDDKISEAILDVLPGCEKVFTYLANSISFKTRATPYSFITAADKGFLRQSLDPGDIIINQWLAKDLGARPGDLLHLRFYRIDRLRTPTEEGVSFIVKSVIPMTSPLEDRSLMPQFPGMSEAGSCRDWETGAPVDLKKIRDKDEKYWNDFRGTPKAFISLTTGQKIWDNPFGGYTAFRFPATNKDLTAIESAIMKKLTPAGSGLIIIPVYAEGQSAANNSTDFGSLFLSLSFFLILSGLLLTALLFSLHVSTRMAETGVMSAIGFSKTQITSILFLEALIVTIAGGILGIIFGIVYTRFLLLGLNTLWQDAVGTTMIQIYLDPGTLLIGFLSGTITSLVVLVLVLYLNLRKPLSLLVKGADLQAFSDHHRNKIISAILSILFLLVSLGLIVYPVLTSQSGQATLFLISGGFMLAAGTTFMNFLFLHTTRNSGNPLPTFIQLVLKNTGLRRSRSLAIIALMALGTFSIIITGANRRTFRGLEINRKSGTGGFLFWAETAFPIMNDLNSAEGKKMFSLRDEEALKDVRYVQMQHLAGDDASCLNLNQVSQPVILAVDPVLFDKPGAFTFSHLDTSIDHAHPWMALNQTSTPGVINAYADQTVITWGLRKSIGDTLVYRDEAGKPLKLVLKGGLDNSIFQGNLLISDSLFRLYYPSAGGSGFMLVDGPYETRKEIGARLEILFRDHGLMLTPASERLAAFNSVENTYLSVFMLLGGLGIILGTVGLGIIILRNLIERRSEIALYLALGFTRKSVIKLLLAEYLFLLLAGVVTGLISALAGILPSLISPSYQPPGAFMALIVLVILVNGFLWIYLLLRQATKTNNQEALKEE